MRKTCFALLLLFFLVQGVSHAQGIFSDEQAAHLIKLTHQNFWGKARLSNGEFVQPGDEKERQTLPISYVEAVRVVQSAAPAGLAAWCNLDWQSYYRAFMKSERSKSWSEIQIAFIGLLFGVAQGNLQKSMAESGTCTDVDREGVYKLLADSIRKHLGNGR